jgi:radical SAM-linked protein
MSPREPVDGGPAAATEPPVRRRFRIRFRKEGLLRFIGHNDLLRAWDRALRRTGLPLKRTEGFHAKTKLSSPTALALGVVGLEEVLDVELTEDVPAQEVLARLRRELPEELRAESAAPLPARGASSTVEAFEYVCRIEGGCAESEVRARRDELLSSPSWIVERRAPGKPARSIDVRSKLESLTVDGDGVRFRVRVDGGSTARPEEVLGILGLGDAWRDGRVLVVRTRVELADDRAAP